MVRYCPICGAYMVDWNHDTCPQHGRFGFWRRIWWRTIARWLRNDGVM